MGLFCSLPSTLRGCGRAASLAWSQVGELWGALTQDASVQSAVGGGTQAQGYCLQGGESRSSQLGLEVGLPPRFTPAPGLPEPSAPAILTALSLGRAWSHLSL